MTLHVKDVIKLFDQVQSGPFNYISSSPGYGVALWHIDAFDILIQHSRLVSWGPLERWGMRFSEDLKYERIEILGPDFLIELEARFSAILANSSNPVKRAMGSPSWEHCYDLHHQGDLAQFWEVLLYHDMIMSGSRL